MNTKLCIWKCYRLFSPGLFLTDSFSRLSIGISLSLGMGGLEYFLFGKEGKKGALLLSHAWRLPMGRDFLLNYGEKYFQKTGYKKWTYLGYV